MDTTRHTGKVAIVTGVANGIGLATARRLAEEGAHVLGFDTNGDALEKARIEVEGLDVTLLEADITRQSDVDEVVAQAGDTRGHLGQRRRHHGPRRPAG